MNGVRVTAGPAAHALPAFARLYGAGEADLRALVETLTGCWVVHAAGGEVVGAAGLRPTPAHGSEVIGGALPGEGQAEAATALVRAALAAQPRLYAYADDAFFPAGALSAAGLREVAAYVLLSGPLPAERAHLPDGFRSVPLSGATGEQRLQAQRAHSDRIGHTFPPPDVAGDDWAGSVDTLGRIAFDAGGQTVGLCRAWLDGETLSTGTPGVLPHARGSGVRRALLLSVCEAARDAGATGLTLEAWGDMPQEQAEDEALGLKVVTRTPIFSSVF